jgi:hypothetical protein
MLAHRFGLSREDPVSGRFFHRLFVNPFRPLCVFLYKYTQMEVVQMKKTASYTVVTFTKVTLRTRARRPKQKLRYLDVTAGQPAGAPV